MNLEFHSRSRWHIFSERRKRPGPEQRQRDFLTGAPLVLIPAVFLFPTWMALVHRPVFAYSPMVAGGVIVVFVVSSAIGTRKLVRCVIWRKFDLIGALASGVLLVLGVTLLYVAMFFFMTYLGGFSE